MDEKPSVDVELAVGGIPAGPNSSIGIDLSVTAALPLPALRVEVDQMRVGLVLELVRGADGFEVVPRVTGPDGPAGAAVAVELPGISGGGQLILAGRGVARRGGAEHRPAQGVRLRTAEARTRSSS